MEGRSEANTILFRDQSRDSIRVNLQMTLQAHAVTVQQTLQNSQLAPSSYSHLLNKPTPLGDFPLNTSFSPHFSASGCSCFCFSGHPAVAFQMFILVLPAFVQALIPFIKPFTPLKFQWLSFTDQRSYFDNSNFEVFQTYWLIHRLFY